MPLLLTKQATASTIVVLASIATAVIWVSSSLSPPCRNVGCVGTGFVIAVLVPGAIWLVAAVASIGVALLPARWFYGAKPGYRLLWLKVLGICCLGLSVLYVCLVALR